MASGNLLLGWRPMDAGHAGGLTGKQTGLGWYGPVFTPSRRPPQGHLD